MNDSIAGITYRGRADTVANAIGGCGATNAEESLPRGQTLL